MTQDVYTLAPKKFASYLEIKKDALFQLHDNYARQKMKC